MKSYLVWWSHGEYEDRREGVVAVFRTKADAEKCVAFLVEWLLAHGYKWQDKNHVCGSWRDEGYLWKPDCAYEDEGKCRDKAVEAFAAELQKNGLAEFFYDDLKDPYTITEVEYFVEWPA